MNIFNYMYEDIKFDINKPIRLFEAFSGYGSQALALQRVGFKVEHVGISEIDKYAIRSHNELHGKVKNYGGIGSFDKLPPGIDICTWSFPCQDISIAGKQKGMVDGSRSNYGYVFLDTVENMTYEERPKILLMENVRALFSETFRDDWREIQLRLENMGYKNYSDILNAKDYGIAQNRERVFILSIKGDYNYNFPKPIESDLRLRDFKENDVIDEQYYLSAKMIAFLYNNNNKQIERGNGFRFSPLSDDSTAKTITTRSGSRMDDNFLIEVGKLKIDGKDMPRHRVYNEDGIATTTTTKIGSMPYYVFNEMLPKGKYFIYEIIGNIIILEDDSKRAFVVDLDDPNNLTIPEATIKGYAKAEEEEDVFYIDRPHQKRGVVQKKSTPTIKTSGNDLAIYTGKRIRKLTPRECGRLMGLRDDEIDKILAVNSNTQAYKQFGNSIVVDVLVAIFKELLLK